MKNKRQTNLAYFALAWVVRLFSHFYLLTHFQLKAQSRMQLNNSLTKIIKSKSQEQDFICTLISCSINKVFPTHRSRISAHQCAMWLKTSKKEIINDHIHHDHLKQYINAKGNKCSYNFLTIDY